MKDYQLGFILSNMWLIAGLFSQKIFIKIGMLIIGAGFLIGSILSKEK